MAQGLIGSLRVTLGLDSARFNRGATDAQRRLQGMRSSFLAVSGVATALGGALTALTIATSKTAMEIRQFSQVANAAPEELQRWAAASKTVGIEQDKLADILKDVNDRVGDFVSTGGGPMADFFEKIAPKVGVTADQFARLSGPEALQLYVTSLEKAGLSQQEMTFYLEAMASDATALIPLLKDGGAEMKRLADDAASLGGIMEASTVASLAALDLSLGRVATSLRGVGYRISGEVAPTLTLLADAFANSMREGGFLRTVIDGLIENLDVITYSVGVAVAAFGVRYVAAFALAQLATFSLTGALVLLRTALIRTGFGALIVGAGFMVAKFMDLVKAVGSFAEAMGLLGEVAAAVWQGMIDSAAAVPPALNGVWNLMKAGFIMTLADMAGAFGLLLTDLSISVANVTGMEGLSGMLLEAGVAAREAASNMGAVSRAASASASGSFASAGAKITAAFGPAREAISAIKGAMVEATSATDAAAESAENLGDAFAGTGDDGGGGAKEAVKAVKDEVTELEKRMESVKNSMQTAFKGLVTGAKSLKETIGDLLGQLGDFLLNSAFNSIWSGIGGGGGLGGFLSGIVGKFATGTSYAPGGMSLVGERGPELVNLPRGSQVLNANQTRGMMGGGGSQNVKIEIIAPEGFTATQRSEAQNISVQVVGQYDKAMPQRVKSITSDPRAT